LENFAYRSNRKKILGLRIFKTRVTLANTSDEAILRYHLIQQGRGFVRAKKERSNNVRKDDRLF
jgi:myo-inositol-hexaphosphate 3-phosphohydrolase